MDEGGEGQRRHHRLIRGVEKGAAAMRRCVADFTDPRCPQPHARRLRSQRGTGLPYWLDCCSNSFWTFEVSRGAVGAAGWLLGAPMRAV
jgi:hypothetical protein